MVHRRLRLLSLLIVLSLVTSVVPAAAAPITPGYGTASAFAVSPFDQSFPIPDQITLTAVPLPPTEQPEEEPAEFADEQSAAVLPPEPVGDAAIYLPLISGEPRVEAGRPLMRVAGAQITTTFAASHDAYVREKYPSSNYNSNSYLRTYQTTGDNYASYLRFVVAGLNGTVQQATLRLYVTNGTS